MTTDAVRGGLGVDVRVLDDLVVVALSGPLDIYTVGGLRVELDAQAPAGDQLVIDLTEVALIDSAGLGALTSLRNQARRDGPGRLGLICPHRRLRRIFEIAGVAQAFSFGSDLAAVLTALGGQR